MKNNYSPAIGLEIHIELNTKSKMFCACENDPAEIRPNADVCPVCLGHPGTLPAMNQEAIKKTIKTGLALSCQISPKTWFDRKSYFYPDLPKGYQISQHFAPFCRGGFLKVDGQEIKIREVHLEEDTCRLLHVIGDTYQIGDNRDISVSESGEVSGIKLSQPENYSLVDCNRAGVPLMELVTEPDLKSAQQAKNFAQELYLLLRYLDVSNADMEKGQLRIEPSVSLSLKKGELGTRVELKNINSFRAMERAIGFEIKRQTEVLNGGGEIRQQTRGWDDKKQETILQREKETSEDYRYFPEPDLPPIEIRQEDLEAIKAELPELPWQKRVRLSQEYHLAENEIEVLVQDKNLSHYFEAVVSELPSNLNHDDLLKLIKLSLNYLASDLLGLLAGGSVKDEKFLVTPENFAELMILVYENKISSRVAKDVLTQMFSTGADPSQIVEERGLAQVTDAQEIEKIVQAVIENNPQPAADFKAGKENALQFLIGQVMTASKGKTHPKLAAEILKKLLS